MEGIDGLNSMKPDLEQKTGYCDPQGAKSDQKYIVLSICMYHMYPLWVSQVSELQKLDIGKRAYSKHLVEIGTPKVNIYMKDFSFFVNISKHYKKKANF